MRGKRVFVACGLVGAIAALGGWIARDWLRAEFYWRQLVAAEGSEAQQWIAAAQEWGPEIEPRLFNALKNADEATCVRAGGALAILYSGPRAAEPLPALAERSGEFSEPAQIWALEQTAAHAENEGPRAQQARRQLIECGLQHVSSQIRLQAVALALQGGAIEPETLRPLIRDPDCAVRRAAVTALGTRREVISDDELLPLLHDSDRDVQRLTRMALLSRGLSERQIRLGRLLTDSRASARLELIGELRNEGELDLSMWLHRLCGDTSPAVRAAAVRTAAELRVFQLRQWIEQMAASDADQSVRAIAQFHLATLTAKVLGDSQ